MKALQPNPETGFLESNRNTTFDSARKVKFIALAKEIAERRQLPSIVELCKAIGITTRCYWEHMSLDAKFHEAWEDVTDICESFLVDTMFVRGQTPGGYMDRITWLRAKKPHRWNPEYKFSIVHDGSSAKGLMDAAKGAIDADIVSELPEIVGNPPAIIPQDDQKL